MNSTQCVIFIFFHNIIEFVFIFINDRLTYIISHCIDIYPQLNSIFNPRFPK